MTARWVGARRFLTAQFAVLAMLGSAACAAPVDDVGGDQQKGNDNDTVESPPAANGNGTHEATGLGTGGGSGLGGSSAGGSSGDGGSGGGQAGTGGGGGGPTEPGLSASFTFEDSDKTVQDVSGHGNDGTIDGTGVTLGQTGKFGNAVSFGGLDGRIVIPGSTDLEFTTAATIEFWIKLNSTAGGTILSHVSSSGDGVRVRTAAGNIQVFFIRAGEGTASVSCDSAALGTVWTHVAVVNDGSALQLYLNGKLIRSESGGHLATAGSDLVIGRSSASDNALNGMLDELNWWTVARTPAQICDDAGGQWSSSYCVL